MNSKMTKNDWFMCSTNAAGFCNVLASKIENAIKRKGNFEEAAAYAGYQASIPPFTGIFNSIPAGQKNTLKAKGEDIIAKFLSNKKYDMGTCVDVIEQIRALYKNDGVMDYTYGNAQKWVNMSFKYYVIFNAIDFNTKKVDLKTAFIKIPEFNNYELFAVDSIMINAIQQKLGINFNYKWSKCNNIQAFIDYWNGVKAKLVGQIIDMPFLWELNNWKSNGNKQKPKSIYYA